MPVPGILSTILDTTGQRVKERVDNSLKLDDEQRKAQGDALLKAIYAVDENGNRVLSDADAEDAWTRYEGLYKHNKSVKDIVLKARDITSKIFGGGVKANPAMAERAKAQTQQAVEAPAAGPEAPADLDKNVADVYTGLAQPPARTSVTPTASATPQLPAPPQRSTVSLMRAGAPNPVKAEIAKEGRAATAESAKLKQQHEYKMAEIEATAKSHGDKKIGSYTGDDEKLHLIFQAADGSRYEIDSEGQVKPSVSRLSPGSKISVSDAQSLATNAGWQFLDVNGQPMDLTKLNLGMELVPISGGMPNRYQPGTQNRVTMTADNKVLTAPALERGNPSLQTTVGAARVPTAGTSESVFINPEGQAEAVTLRQTSAPVTPAPVIPPPQAPSNVNITPPPPRTPITPPPAPSAGGGSRPLGNLLPAAERDKQLQVARPVRAAAVQLFGDPNNPNVESLVSFAKIADDPKARERVGTAARMIINDLTAADKAGGIGAQVLGEGASLHGGDVWQVLKNKAGMPQWLASSQVSATENALKALTPEEARMLNQIMAAYGTVVGLRTLTKGGAYQFSVASMERELPIPGIADVNSSANYYNKLAKIANEVVEGSKGISDGVLPEKKFYQTQADMLNRLGQSQGAGSGPTPPPARSSGDRIKVKGPNGETGTATKGSPLPPGWTEVK